MLTNKLFNKVTKVINSVSFSDLPNSNKYVVMASDNPCFSAIKDKDNQILYVHFDKYSFKKNDQIVDEHDMSYFVKAVDSKFEFEINDRSYTVQKIAYEEKPLSIPTYVSQSISNSININASGSTFHDMNVQNTFATQMSYNQILADLENVINNCFHIKEYKQMLSIFKNAISEKKEIEESKLKKFFKLMGTQIKRLVELFLTAYAAALANKTL